ncbi:MAG: RecX family transcriptional regulator [Treponema sp.]|nr:RecX family transcriptional regulator [Treponema sp.]
MSDGSLFSLNPQYLPPEYRNEGYFCPEKDISANEERALRFASACCRAEKAALRLTARAEQNRAGLIRKLEQRGHEERCIKAVVTRLGGIGILDDSRYAALWIRARLNRGVCGPYRLIQTLMERGVNRHIALEARKTVLDFERETALLIRYLEKKGLLPEADPYLKQRLKREGFSSVVLKAYWESL